VSTADTRFQAPQGTFELRRYPARRAEPLKAWCAADALLLEEVERRGLDGEDCLVVNDEHGALCVALAPPQLWTDSALSVIALERNLARNRRPPVAIRWSTEAPAPGFTLVILRVPKQLAFFEYQLAGLARALAPGALVLAAGMDKHLSPHTATLLERYIGPTQRHRGERKARLFSALRDSHPAPAPPAPDRYRCAPLDAELVALPNLFSRDRLDPGSALLLQQLQRLAPAPRILDLACGNGVLGLAALRRGLGRELVGCDESAMAVASARINAAALLPGRETDLHWHLGDGLRGWRGAPCDLILCNPPFHLQHTVDDFAGRHLLAGCAAGLASGGRLCLVANRHLDYREVLRRDFLPPRPLARDAKFTVWLAERR